MLWRPHPLLGVTLKAMRPEMCEEYEKLVEEYRRDGWVIYDDSPDIDRVVRLSDGYYEDHSNMVQLC